MFSKGSFQGAYRVRRYWRFYDPENAIEDYPDDNPFPSGLFFGWQQDKPLHVVPEVYVITAYEPDQEHFEADFRTRRKK
jgi:hypothetical protein